VAKALEEDPDQSGSAAVDDTAGAEGWLTSSHIAATREGVTLHDLNGAFATPTPSRRSDSSSWPLPGVSTTRTQ